MLKCETNTPQIENEIMSAANERGNGIKPIHTQLTITFEHGQWWLQCATCGATWSVHDCQKDGIDFLGFEEVSAGDGFCLEVAAEQAELNTNCLESMKCPKCSSLGPFGMNILQRVMVSDEGTDTPQGDCEWDDTTFCMCAECGFEGTVADYYIEKKEVIPPPKIVKPYGIPSRDLATIIAALRYWQEEVVKDETYGEYLDFFAAHSPLSAEEIDTLCERLNFGENIDIPNNEEGNNG